MCGYNGYKVVEAVDRKRGRPSKYESHVLPKLNRVEAWARDGLTDEQIAHNLGVAYSTFREYVKAYPALSASLKEGKDDIDIQVENALLKRALGYKYEEVTYEAIEIKSGSGEDVVIQPAMKIKTVVKEVQPDTTAQIFWLKNRRPHAWRDKQDIEHSGKVTQEIQHDLRKLDPAELAQLERLLSKATEE